MTKREPALSAEQTRVRSLRARGLTIEVVAEQAGVTVQRVRYFERNGIVAPIWRDNRTSFYDEQAIERVRLVRRLMDELGVNLPGAEVILHMRERTLTLIDELERLRRQRP